jgi:hypothetical protein
MKENIKITQTSETNYHVALNGRRIGQIIHVADENAYITRGGFALFDPDNGGEKYVSTVEEAVTHLVRHYWLAYAGRGRGLARWMVRQK